MSASCSLEMPSLGSSGPPQRNVTLDAAQIRNRSNNEPASARKAIRRVSARLPTRAYQDRAGEEAPARPTLLPNPDALLRFQIVFAVANVERLVPGIEVANDERPEMAGRVGIDGEQLLQQLVAILGAPDLAVAQEEALIAGEAVDHRRRLAAQRHLVGVVGDGEAGQVRDILAEGQLAVHLHARQRLVGAILGDHLVGQLLEGGDVGLAPPVGEIAAGVELAALIVKMMADLMADDRADAAIIDRVVRIGIEE